MTFFVCGSSLKISNALTSNSLGLASFDAGITSHSLLAPQLKLFKGFGLESAHVKNFVRIIV
jgi:hypothetical protein